MDELVESVSSELPPDVAQHTFKTLLQVIDKVLSESSDVKYRCLAKCKITDRLPPVSLQLLEACGYVDRGEVLELPQTADLETVSEAQEMFTCILLSFDAGDAADNAEDVDIFCAERQLASTPAQATAAFTPPPRGAAAQATSGISAAVDDVDPELARALQLSLQEVGSPAAGQASPKEVEFQRFDPESMQVESDAVEKLNRLHQESGEPFVDPQFPADARSIFADEEDARTWRCPSCNTRSELPPVPPFTKSQEELEQQIEYFGVTSKCRNCARPPPPAARSQYASRPSQWLRPGVHCQICEQIYADKEPEVRKELIARMCTHFLRDPVSETTVGEPWLIRGEARAEDVCQGALGNCWFVGALSVIARYPRIIDSLFEGEPAFNPAGAYTIRLCHAGQWRRILIDDLLPTGQVSQGHVNCTNTQYSAGGMPCYIQCARRQLWAPLVEKAAAKLFGSYETLKGGNLGEALALFTGCPTRRVRLYEPVELRQRRAQYRQAKAGQRQQLLLQGRPVPDRKSVV